MIRLNQELMCLVPPLSEEEFAQLEENIVSEGKCREAIVMWDGKIIDGYNRLRVCLKHGIEFRVEELNFESWVEAKAWILENQLGRRNLGEAAKIELVALTKSSKGSRKEIAKETGLGEGTVQRYESIKKESPALLAQVQQGKMKIGKAYNLLPSQIIRVC